MTVSPPTSSPRARSVTSADEAAEAKLSDRRPTLSLMETDELLVIAKPIVWRRGHRAGLSTEDREALLQEVIFKYLDAWPDGEAPTNVAAWFETATSNAVIDRARAADRRPAADFTEGADDPVSLLVAAKRSSQFTSLEAVQKKLIASTLGLLPPEDGELLRRRYLDRESAADVAADLAITVTALDQRTTRAKRKLRDALAARPDLVEELRVPHPHVY